MKKAVSCRKAAADDIDAVTDLLFLLYKSPQASREELITENERLFADNAQAFFLAFYGDMPVGVSHASLRREYVNGANDGIKGFLEAVYVLPEYRLNGVASKLVTAAERWAGLRGCAKFASDCLLENTGSHDFHIKIGFKETERSIFFLKVIAPEKYEIRPIDAALREKIQPVLNETWGAPQLVVNGKLWDSRMMPGYAAVGGGEVLGYLLYEFHGGICEIMALESVAQNIGIASALIERIKQTAKSNGAVRLIVQTSNDNTRAIRFYQRRRFTISEVRLGALAAARRLKPSIPLIGEDAIPLRDEIEFVIEI